MRRPILILAALAALPLMAATRAPERWLAISPREPTRGPMAVDLNSVRPSQTKGLDDVQAIEVIDAKSVWLHRYEVRCGRGLIHEIERHGLDPKSGRLGPSAAVNGDWGKPDGYGEQELMELVCHHGGIGGDVISDRRAAIWILARGGQA
jgi:hypothetical protein